MKIKIYILVSSVVLLVSHTDFAHPQSLSSKSNKDYHLIYLDISRCEDRQNMTYRLTGLLDSILSRKADFLLYLSNGYQPELLSSDNYQKQQKDYIISLLQTLNTSPPILKFDKDSIYTIWDIYDIKDVTPENKTLLLYKNIYLHYFISPDLYALEKVEIIDNFLLIKDLTKKHIDAQRIVVNLLFSKKDSKAFLEQESGLANNNVTGYRYIFSSY